MKKYPPLTCPNCESFRVNKARNGTIYCEDCKKKTTVAGNKHKIDYDPWEPAAPDIKDEYDAIRNLFPASAPEQQDIDDAQEVAEALQNLFPNDS